MSVPSKSQEFFMIFKLHFASHIGQNVRDAFFVVFVEFCRDFFPVSFLQTPTSTRRRQSRPRNSLCLVRPTGDHPFPFVAGSARSAQTFGRLGYYLGGGGRIAHCLDGGIASALTQKEGFPRFEFACLL
jgi:hypothetical protein